MIPQGSTLLNTDTFDNLTASVKACASCEELQSLVDEAFASIDAVKAGINMELAKLQPMLALLTAPSANPAAIVTWISSFISSTLTPLTLPSINYAAQLNQVLAEVAKVTDAINVAASNFPSCSIDIPA